MKKIKRVLRLLVLIGLIVLASIGIGISGGIPLPLSKNRRDTEKDPIELIDNQEENSVTHQGQLKK